MDNTQHQKPAVVEEESSQEFYANLIEKRPQAAVKLKSSVTRTSHRRRHASLRDSQQEQPQPQPQQQSSLPVVLSEETTTTTTLNNVYQRAMENPKKLSSLSLDASNKGFKLLHKMGWKETDGGLGKQRQGTLTPIKTVIKNDKCGLGRKRQEKQVTHQQETSVEQPKETKAQRKRRKKMEHEKEQHRQKRARMLLRTDVSDEYEQLYMSLHHGGG